MTDGRVRIERDPSTGVARLTLDNPERKNAYDPAMRRQLATYLDDLADDNDIKVVVLRGEGGVFSTGADMNNAYDWYGDGAKAEVDPAPTQPAATAARRPADVRASTTSSSGTRR